jgi:hypothetical protein
MRSNSKRILYCQSWPLSPLCTSTPNTKSTHPNSAQASVPRCPRSADGSMLLAGPGIPEASTLKSILGKTGRFPFFIAISKRWTRMATNAKTCSFAIWHRRRRAGMMNAGEGLRYPQNASSRNPCDWHPRCVRSNGAAGWV